MSVTAHAKRLPGWMRILPALLALVAASPCPGAEIAPHVAGYRLALRSASGTSGVKAVKGRLEIRLEASCDGWTVQQFVAFDLLADDDTYLEHLARLKSFESRDGREFVFASQTWEDRKLVEDLSGSARRRPGGGVDVRYSTPRASTRTLPAGIVFPAAHLSALIDEAKRGGRQMLRVVFDGSTEDNPFEVSSYIGPGYSTPASLAAAPGALQGRQVWPVRLAYFLTHAVEPGAEFEMSVELYDHGVAGNMIFDYGDFAMDVVLEELSVQPPPRCGS